MKFTAAAAANVIEMLSRGTCTPALTPPGPVTSSATLHRIYNRSAASWKFPSPTVQSFFTLRIVLLDVMASSRHVHQIIPKWRRPQRGQRYPHICFTNLIPMRPKFQLILHYNTPCLNWYLFWGHEHWMTQTFLEHSKVKGTLHYVLLLPRVQNFNLLLHWKPFLTFTLFCVEM